MWRRNLITLKHANFYITLSQSHCEWSETLEFELQGVKETESEKHFSQQVIEQGEGEVKQALININKLK